MIIHPSPNFNARPAGTRIDTLILHYTGMPDAASAIALLCDPAAEVSAHYVVEEDGQIWQLVEETQRAWHAGVSHWRGRDNLNDNSIGIEIVNPGHEWGYRPFPPAQMAAVLKLCQALIARHPIAPRNVLAHSDIAPNRKQDPGELFDWPWLAAHGVGIWPDGPDLGTAEADHDPNLLRANLRRIGYPIAAQGGMDGELACVLTAFQRHFRPEAVNGRADRGTVERVAAVLEKVKEGSSFCEQKEAKKP